MTANVWNNDIIAHVEGSDVPWHETNCVTFKPGRPLREQWESTSLNFTVRTEPLQIVADGREVDHRAVVRNDNNEIFSVVGPRWTAMQPGDMLDVLEPFAADGLIELATAGTVRGGRRMWAQFTMPGHESTFDVAPGDPIKRFFSLAQGLDGILGIHTGWCHTRQVCENTLLYSLAEGGFTRIRHFRFCVDTVRQLLESIDWESQSFFQTIEQYRFLVSRGVSRADLRKYVRIVLDADPEKDFDELHTRTQNTVRRVEQLFESGIGNDNPRVSGTWWAAYNGMTQFLTHEKGRTADSRRNNLWFGNGRHTLDKALETAVELADLSSVA